MNLAEYIKTDRNTFWKLSSGAVLNLLDEAIERIDELEAQNKQLKQALADAAEMTEYEENRTLIYNHCKQAAEAAGEKK